MSTIAYPINWVSGQILNAADLNSEFAAVNNITGITTGQLAVGASLNAAATAVAGSNSITNTETTIVTLPSITTRGGRVLLTGTLSMSFTMPATTTGTATLRWYRGATLIAAYSFTLGNSNAQAIVAPLPTPTFSEQPSAGTAIYKITGQASSGTISVTVAGTDGGLFALELA